MPSDPRQSICELLPPRRNLGHRILVLPARSGWHGVARPPACFARDAHRDVLESFQSPVSRTPFHLTGSPQFWPEPRAHPARRFSPKRGILFSGSSPASSSDPRWFCPPASSTLPPGLPAASLPGKIPARVAPPENAPGRMLAPSPPTPPAPPRAAIASTRSTPDHRIDAPAKVGFVFPIASLSQKISSVSPWLPLRRFARPGPPDPGLRVTSFFYPTPEPNGHRPPLSGPANDG